jgi:hypothetical protein
MPILIIICGTVITIGMLALAFRSFRHKRIIDDMPTSKTQGVFIGLTELKGTAESDSPLISFLAEVKCVWVKWHIDEQWSRMVTETYRDAQGHTQVRTRRETGWTTVANGSESIPFYLKDDTGIIRVVPDGASISAKEVMDKTCTPLDNLYFQKGPEGEIANSDHRRRFHEMAIPLHTQLYVVGHARERQDVVAAEIAKDKNSQIFIISTRTEKQISRNYVLQFWLWFILGFFISIGTPIGWVLLDQISHPVLWQPAAIGGVVYLFLTGLGWLWTVYNNLVNLRQRVRQAWSQIDIQLKRRSDLIPNLVKVIEGYRAHEADVQVAIAEMRTQMLATPPGVSGPDYKGLLPTIRTVIERYPDLKASGLFLELQKSLVETEQRIALARDYYNNIATFYNIRLEIIPDRFVASSLRLRAASLLLTSDFERAPVQVKFVE